MPCSQKTVRTPDRLSTSRSSRSMAAGPPRQGPTPGSGPHTWLPPMPALKMAMSRRPAAHSSRCSTSVHRSCPLSVVAVPSVSESPKAANAHASPGSQASRASAKKVDVRVWGNPSSLSDCAAAVPPGADRYEVAMAFACQVMGPLAPSTQALKTRLRPSTKGAVAAGSAAHSMAGVHAAAPAAMDWSGSAMRVPGTTAPPP